MIKSSDLHLITKSNNASRCTVPIRIQVAVHNYVNVEASRICTLNLIRSLQVASCLLVGKGSSSSSSRWTGCDVPGCDDRRTWNIARWQLKYLEKQLDGLGWDSTCTCAVRNIRLSVVMERPFSWSVILCTIPIIIALLQQDNPTDCKTVIECLYWKAAPERTVNQNFHLNYL